MNALTAEPAPAAPTLSVVIPVFNEELGLTLLHQRLTATLATLQESFEIIYVDDGSKDGSPSVLKALQADCANVGVVRFSRNFGKEQAITAGLQLVRGEAVILLDADLQHPPEMIPAMVKAWREGADVVNMRRRSREGESWPKRTAAKMFYRLINRLSDVPIPADVGDFRLFSRRAVNALNRLPERNRFMKGLFAWIGYHQVTIDFDVAPRAAGESKWPLRQLWHFALEGVTAFSIMPLKLAAKAGLLSALIALCYGGYILIHTLIYGDPVPGFPTLIIVVLMLGGLQLMAIGILGEYLGRLSLESKQRPLFLIEHYEPPKVYEQSAQASPGVKV